MQGCILFVCCFVRYFMMVVGLYATVSEEKSFLLVANVSERLIVRVSVTELLHNTQLKYSNKM